MDLQEKKIRVLLVEDNPADARLIQELSSEDRSRHLQIDHVDTLSKALQRLAKGGIDSVLLDLHLPDSMAIDTFDKIYTQYSKLPIVILTGLSDETLSIMAVRKGAQDYLVKGNINSPLLVRSVLYAVERKRLEETVKEQANTDDLTGIPNRRHFYEIAAREIERCRRYKHPFTIVFLDCDNFKVINDTLGHDAGDRVLRMMAASLKQAVRATDTVGRFGGDEFIVLLIETNTALIENIVTRIKDSLTAVMRKNNLSLTFSIGAVIFFQPPESFDDMTKRVDEAMYRVKNSGKDAIQYETYGSSQN